MSTATMEFDLRGVIGIQLVDPAVQDVAVVRDLLGVSPAPLGRPADIVVRFVSALPTPGLRFVEVHRSGYTDDEFIVLGDSRRPMRAAVPLDRIGNACEIRCQHGSRSIPFLLDAIKLTALTKGYLPFHGAAFELDGAGVLVTGWAHGGKTSALLAFGARGATFLADDLVLLRGDGSSMNGVPTSLSVSDAQLAQLPDVRRRVSRRRRAFFAAVRALEGFGRRIGSDSIEATGVARQLGAVLPSLRRRCKIGLRPEVLFGGRMATSALPRVLFLMLSHAAPEVVVEEVPPDEAFERVRAQLRYEGRELQAQYQAYRFAFPGLSNPLIENAHVREAELLRSALASLRTFVVRHPYPALLDDLFRAMDPIIAAAAAPAWLEPREQLA